MRVRKFSDLLLVVVFCLCLVLPFAFADFEGGKPSEVENRYMARAPHIFTENGLRLQNIKTDFEAWIDDNVGGRTQMVAANTWLRYRLFHESVHGNTLIGKKSWTYYINDAILRDYQRINLLGEEDLADWTGSLKTVQDALETQGIAFSFSLVPDKKTVYPEYYPDSVLRLADTTRSRQWADAAREAGVSFLLLEEPLLAAKASDTVYSPRLDSSHWNSLGAYTAYQAMLEEAQALLPGIHRLQGEILPAEPGRSGGYPGPFQPGTEVVLLPVLRQGMYQGVIPLTESDWEITVLQPSAMVRDETFFDDLTQLSYAGNPGEFALRLVNPDSDLPKLLLVADSYYELMMPLLQESFSEITFLHVADAEHLQTLVDKAQPDIVLVEMVERMVDMHFHRFLTLAESYRP